MFLRDRDLLTFALILAALCSCGDDAKKNEGRATTDAALCRRICARSAAAECANDPVDCATECGSLIAGSPESCESELAAFTACAEKAKFTCDDDDESEARSCANQLAAWKDCADVDDAPTPDDDDEEVTGDVDDEEANPEGDGATDEGLSPVSSPEGAVCEEVEEDSECDTCMKGACCESLRACDAECAEVVRCVNACTETECAQECLVGVPAEVIPPFYAVAQCLAKSCDAICTHGRSDDSAPPPTTELPVACQLAGSELGDKCDVPEKANAYTCEAPPFPDCIASPTGEANLYCCSQ